MAVRLPDQSGEPVMTPAFSDYDIWKTTPPWWSDDDGERDAWEAHMAAHLDDDCPDPDELEAGL